MCACGHLALLGTASACSCALWRLVGRPPSTRVKSRPVAEQKALYCTPVIGRRGAGFLSLEALLFMAQRRGAVFGGLMRKEAGARSDWEYPFAAAGVNITFMLAGGGACSTCSFYLLLSLDLIEQALGSSCLKCCKH